MSVTLDFLNYFGWALLYCAPLLIFFTVIIFSAGFCAGRLEEWSWTDTIYWTIITATTVGYGDFRPVKHRSRLYSIIIIIVGMMFTGLIVAITISATTESLRRHINLEPEKARLEQSLRAK